MKGRLGVSDPLKRRCDISLRNQKRKPEGADVFCSFPAFMEHVTLLRRVCLSEKGAKTPKLWSHGTARL